MPKSGRRNEELRLDAPLAARSVNMNRSFCSASLPFPFADEPLVARLPSRSSRIRRSSLASSNASNEPNLSTATSSTGLPSSSAVS